MRLLLIATVEKARIRAFAVFACSPDVSVNVSNSVLCAAQPCLESSGQREQLSASTSVGRADAELGPVVQVVLVRGTSLPTLWCEFRPCFNLLGDESNSVCVEVMTALMQTLGCPCCRCHKSDLLNAVNPGLS